MNSKILPLIVLGIASVVEASEQSISTETITKRNGTVVTREYNVTKLAKDSQEWLFVGETESLDSLRLWSYTIAQSANCLLEKYRFKASFDDSPAKSGQISIPNFLVFETALKPILRKGKDGRILEGWSVDIESASQLKISGQKVVKYRIYSEPDNMKGTAFVSRVGLLKKIQIESTNDDNYTASVHFSEYSITNKVQRMKIYIRDKRGESTYSFKRERNLEP